MVTRHFPETDCLCRSKVPRSLMEEPIVEVITFEESGQPRTRGGPLGRSWKLLASVNLFILSLKSKWRRNRRVKLARLSHSGGTGSIYEASPRLLVNNWTASHTAACTSSISHSPRGSTVGSGVGLNLGSAMSETSRPSTAGSHRLSRRLTSFVGIYNNNGRRMSVRNMWQNLTKGRSDSPERRASHLGVIDARVSCTFTCLHIFSCATSNLACRKVITGRHR